MAAYNLNLIYFQIIRCIPLGNNIVVVNVEAWVFFTRKKSGAEDKNAKKKRNKF